MIIVLRNKYLKIVGRSKFYVIGKENSLFFMCFFNIIVFFLWMGKMWRKGGEVKVVMENGDGVGEWRVEN